MIYLYCHSDRNEYPAKAGRAQWRNPFLKESFTLGKGSLGSALALLGMTVLFRFSGACPACTPKMEEVKSMYSNVVVWSDGIFRIFKVRPGSIKINFDTYLKFVHPDDKKKVKKDIFGAIKKGWFSHDVRSVVEGDEFTHYVEGRTIYESKDPVRMIGTSVDITELKKTEEKLKEKIEELEKMNKLMVGREIKMFGLKKEINNRLGRESKLSHLMEVNTNDEVEQFTQDFKKKSGKLTKSQLDIEKKIKARTSELEILNKYMIGILMMLLRRLKIN